MASIAVYSVKGGVGKTTFAVNLAWCAATISCRETLLWDLDPANGSGFLLDVDARAKRPARGVFEKAREPRKLARKTAYGHLALLPADESIRALDRQFDEIDKRNRLAKLVDELGRDFDRIVFDCPPVMNSISAQVVRAADLVIVPLPPSPLSARALDLVKEEVRGKGSSKRRKSPAILPVLSMVDMRRTLHRDAREANPDWPMVPLASAIEQCAVERGAVGGFAPRSSAARAFAQLWTVIERRLAG